MTMPSDFYEEKLYHLQDGILTIISQSDTDFFLTGGTALSRAYFNHRYSDDLDFFINNSQTYRDQVDKIFSKLRENGYFWSEETDYLSADYFTTLMVGHRNFDVLLKLDFVNDIVPYFGEIQKTKIYYRTDNVRNILSNKLSAIYRLAEKDTIDIWAIATHETINWKALILEAKEKDLGVEPIYVSDILRMITKTKFDNIAWVKKPDWETFKADIDKITMDILSSE
jgi:predicted nucleotidyltransferase component of viral defense system